MVENKEINTKIVAFHLPQFHSFPENDKWWGKGFTEWNNVKSAKPLFPGHNQPREPKDDNYYDLSKVDNMIAQMELAKEYGIYAFCYYHYWFDGKLLLHKPLEAIRDYDGIKLNYFFCWANEPWARTWDGHETDMLMPQRYGNEKEWEEHFSYLLTFFKDQYYEKIENCPVIVLYRSNNIPRCDDMIMRWNELCIENGFNGIYVVEEKNGFQNQVFCKNSRACLDFEPGYTLNFGRTWVEHARDKVMSETFNIIMKKHNLINIYSFVWKRLIYNTIKWLKNDKSGKECFPGAFVDWDNTPRKKDKGRIFLGVDPKKFSTFFRQQFSISQKYNCRYLFINAWNEWGEGAFLEPDKKNGLCYLESVRNTIYDLYNLRGQDK